MLTNRSLKRHLLTRVAAGGLCLFMAGSTLAADCGCAASHHVSPTSSSDCYCSCAKGKKKHNCVYRALDAVAGGIEKLLRLDSWDDDCCETICDDGCDAAMVEELMLPLPSSETHRHHHQQEQEHIQPSSPPVDSDSTQEAEVVRTAPRKGDDAEDVATNSLQSELTAPRFESLDSPTQLRGNTLVETDALTPRVTVLEPDMEIRRQPKPTLQPRTERGSSVEPLTNPFNDDPVNPFLDDQTRTRTYQPVRPTSYQDFELRPISRRPLPQPYSESSRRVRNVR